MDNVIGQMDLFGGEYGEPKFEIIDNRKNSSDPVDEANRRINLVEFSMVSENNLTIEELFSSYDTIKVITYSYDMNFMNRIAGMFKHAEVIMGASFMATRKDFVNDMCSVILANANYVRNSIPKHANIVRLMREGNMEIHVPRDVKDHRKIYLLKSDSGNTRVIFGSANATYGGWGGNQLEFTGYCDTPELYDTLETKFEVSWMLSDNIPFNMVAVDKSDNSSASAMTDEDAIDEELIDNNVILSGKKKSVETLITVVSDNSEDTNERVNYCIDMDKLEASYKKISKGVFKADKNGVCEIQAKSVSRLKTNLKRIANQYKSKMETVTKDYPSFTFDLESQKAFVDNKELDLHPCEADIKSDLKILLNVFKNFDDFIDPSGELKNTHFKMMNGIFASSVFSHMRCVANVYGIATESMPLYLLAYSNGSNCGKTFMIKFLMKMMCGKILKEFSCDDLNSDRIKGLLYVQSDDIPKGTPVFVDEISNKWFSLRKDECLKHVSDTCENKNNDTRPMLIMASNNVLEPEEPIRKRLIYLRFDASLPSTHDKAAMSTKGKAIISSVGTAFYREYFRRLMEKCVELVAFMETEQEANKENGFYPDILKISSNILVDMFKEYNDGIVPDYAKELGWHLDYDLAVVRNAILNLKEEYKINPDAFSVKGKYVIFEQGGDNESKKKIDALKNTLPSEFEATVSSSRESNILQIARVPLEQESGMSFKKSALRSLVERFV